MNKFLTLIAVFFISSAVIGANIEESKYAEEYKAYQAVLVEKVEKKEITEAESKHLDIQKRNELDARIKQESDNEHAKRMQRLQGFGAINGILNGGSLNCRANTIGNRTYTNCR